MVQQVIWRGVRLDPRTRDMMEEVARNTGSIYVNPTQGSWSGAAASAGTHTGCGAIDLMHPSWDVSHYNIVVREMRRVGFAAWHRTPQQSNWPRHVHGIAVQPGGKHDRGCLAGGAHSQVIDYYEGRNGLASRAPDDGPRTWVGRTWEDYVAKQTLVVATLNHPARYGRPPLNRLGAKAVALQEVGDDVRVPKGWRRFRPKVNRSTAVAWKGGKKTPQQKGRVKVGSDPADRYLTWVRIRTIPIASVHLPAFKDKNGPQHTAQMKRIAAWMKKHPRAVVLGDFNAGPDSTWMQPLRDVGATGVSAKTHKNGRLDQAWSIEQDLTVLRTVDTGSDHKALVVGIDLSGETRSAAS